MDRRAAQLSAPIATPSPDADQAFADKKDSNMRLAAFVISLLLLDGAIDPTRGWLIALVVITGLSMMRVRFRGTLVVKPAIDLRLGAFIFAVLLLAGTIEPTKDWLIGLSILTGFAMAMPGVISFDIYGDRQRRRAKFWAWTTDNQWASRIVDGDWGEDAEWEIDRSSRRGRRGRPSRRNRGDEWA